MKNKIYLLIGILLSTLACEKDIQNNEQKNIPVKVYRVRPDTITTYLDISGNLEAKNDALIYGQVTEQLRKISKPVGAKVKSGDIIAVVENKIWRETLNQAEASLKSIEARHEQVKSDYDRYQRLYNEQAISQQQWEKIRSSWQESEAALARMRAAYQQASEQFEKTYIIAPFDGIVGSLYYDVGQMVTVGKPVAKIVDTEIMKAYLYIPDIHLTKLHINQKVVVSFPVLPGRKFTGYINQADPAIDPLTRTVEVEVIFPNKENELKSGLYGLFKLELSRHDNVLVLPDNALIRRTQLEINRNTGETYTTQKFYVYTVKNDTARQVEVFPGAEDDSRVEILKGLQTEDLVVVVGQKIIKDGSPVQIITE